MALVDARPGVGQDPPLRVEDQQAAAQQLHQRGGHLGEPTPAEDQGGEALVGLRGSLHRGAVGPDPYVRGVEVEQRLLGFGEQAGVLDGDGGMGAQR